jgi:UDP-N-acetylglucosamine 2-epimerase (non-hydrolysing)
MIRVLAVLGTRPEAIKMAPVIQELRRHPNAVSVRVCVTAQHREMLDQALSIFDIAPDLDLDLMEPDQALPELTGRVLARVTDILLAETPDLVLVQGDTTTVMAAALASFYQRVPVGHVEAGLRTRNPYSPFPEEINRRITTVLTAYHFAPTETARAALLREGVSDDRIWVTGNTVIDALYATLRRPVPRRVHQLLQNLGVLRQDGSTDERKLILVTAHRRENLPYLEQICAGLRCLVERNPDVVVLYPVHLNPNVRAPVHRALAGVDRLVLTDPFDYASLAHCMQAAYLVLTDSGGIQEEAPALGKPVLVMRTETERPEAVDAGTVKVIGTSTDAIVGETERLLRDHQHYRRMSRVVSPYGDGHAAERIARVILAIPTLVQ